MTKIFIFAILSLIFIGCNNQNKTEEYNPKQHLEYTQKLNGYNLPKNKQGIADRNPLVFNEDRYNVFEKDMTLGIQKFNYYWRDAENGSPSSSSLIECDNKHFLFPTNIEEKKSLGIQKYHCYNREFIDNWTSTFDFNSKHNIQTSVVLWTAPSMYIDPGCEGFYFSMINTHLMEGCLPTPKHYEDYEDWIRFTAFKFGDNIDHYVVWNEVSSTNWTDSSTSELTKSRMTTNLETSMNKTLSIYTELLKRTIRSVTALDHTCLGIDKDCKNLVYVSLDAGWYEDTPTFTTHDYGIHIDWKNVNVLNYIWSHLDFLEYPWAIAIHPYGAVYKPKQKSLNFNTLSEISIFQKEKIDKHNIDKLISNNISPKFWLEYPQSRLFVNEQNVDGDNTIDEKTQFICESYDVSFNRPEIIGITHNHFQDNITTTYATYHTMLPPTIEADFSNAYNFEPFLAYLSTSINTWGKSNKHICCQSYKLGCKY